MSTVHIDLGSRSYDIHIRGGLLQDEEIVRRSIAGKQVVIVTNEVVAPLYLKKLQSLLTGFEVHTYILGDGEQTKTLENFSQILDYMLAIPCDRKCTILALGGGVIGDLSGFVAASYQRGIPFIQIPTTLLSQVDSSVGGKTGVNHPLGKNMIGAFVQPQVVIADLDTLETLDDRQFSAGLAEVIKYGLINDLPFFEWLETNIDLVMSHDRDALEYIVARSCENKRTIVQQDETEQGVRALLNLGHTFGHAIETATGYTRWLHGEAVAIGMVMAADLSRRIGWLSDDDVERVSSILQRANLPTGAVGNVNPAHLRQLMQGDKKVLDGTLRLILLKELGQAVISDDADQQALMATLGSFTTT